jgi:hypothetical protein
MLLGNWITRFTESLANGPVRVEIYPPVMSVVAEWTHGKKRAGQIEAENLNIRSRHLEHVGNLCQTLRPDADRVPVIDAVVELGVWR